MPGSDILLLWSKTLIWGTFSVFNLFSPHWFSFCCPPITGFSQKLQPPCLISPLQWQMKKRFILIPYSKATQKQGHTAPQTSAHAEYIASTATLPETPQHRPPEASSFQSPHPQKDGRCLKLVFACTAMLTYMDFTWFTAELRLLPLEGR